MLDKIISFFPFLNCKAPWDQNMRAILNKPIIITIIMIIIIIITIIANRYKRVKNKTAIYLQYCFFPPSVKAKVRFLVRVK